ncbi:cell division protein ZapD [Idiomarina xiamenensis]|uniref:Cell division protein ZapD n=1 Tax=Idiomarina xiamenensis 10-D-4 TaxID=740709 RepID=K2KF13_9GAMM|nr:cell division protein ZapD [Idiomarina xiamenensis]EKE85322.1 hypothetical protein A10D4_03220 [Idiomarina xiamenensis 10-D-4]
MQTIASPAHWVTYEFPLQERLRAYLRLEQLLNQLHNSDCQGQHYQPYFSALFAIVELLERSDARGDLLKDLEKRDQLFKQWANHPAVDTPALQATHQRLVSSLQRIQASLRITQDLKQDKLLSSIRQRFAMPGATCLFDVPQLQFWLAQDEAFRQQQQQYWWQQLQPLSDGLQIELTLLREQASFADEVASNGLLQESSEPLAMLRLLVPHELPAYPVVSGHKQRFTIRFMRWEGEQGKPAYEENVQFKLARCQ